MGPLTGIRVVAFEQAIALPFASLMLSELGAEVIKIERPGNGDVVRGWDEAVRGLSSGFIAFNAGKRDITLDVSSAEGREVLLKLAGRADVFLENFAPGVVQRLGVSDADLRPINPKLVYCSLSGYGQSGPFRDVKAYDLLIQGESGILFTNGYPDAPAKVGMPITDLIAGSHAAIGITAALYEREKTELGKYLDVALLESAIFWLGYFPHYAWHQRPQPPRTGMRHQFICPYGPFMASDGKYVSLVVASQEHWRIFCSQVVERAEWLDDPRFESMAARTSHREQLDALVEEAIAGRPQAHWLAQLSAAGLPYGLVREMEDVVEHPQLHHRGIFVEDESPVGRIPLVRFPLSDRERRPVPGLGQHTDEILSELGYSPGEISSLRERGVV